jgi:hypothetical protein
VVEHFTSKCEVLSSNATTANNKKAEFQFKLFLPSQVIFLMYPHFIHREKFVVLVSGESVRMKL